MSYRLVLLAAVLCLAGCSAPTSPQTFQWGRDYMPDGQTRDSTYLSFNPGFSVSPFLTVVVPREGIDNVWLREREQPVGWLLTWATPGANGSTHSVHLTVLTAGPTAGSLEISGLQGTEAWTGTFPLRIALQPDGEFEVGPGD